MKVKKFVAPTMPEAMNHIRKELGPEAVILNSKEVLKGGIFGLFKKRNIEVVAALDPQPKPIKSENAPVTRSTTPETRVNDASVLNEIKQLRKMVEVQTVNHDAYPPDYQVIYHYLLTQEIDEDLTKNILDDVIRKHENEDIFMTDHDTILREVIAEIQDRLKTLCSSAMPEDKKLVKFVGPTGAGKTTTIAKVAASKVMKDNKRVALITADTYRIAAIEQLKTYAGILNIPLEVVYNPADYKAAVQKFASYDSILVDTAGRNFREEKYVWDLEKSITFNENAETCLVLSLTAKANDITKVYDQFKHLPIQNVIFTKVDETRQYGSILNIALKNKLGIAFLTNGQDVPDDILKPSPEGIGQLIAGERNGA